MASTDTGTYWENLGYIGELYTASPKEAPFLSAIGSLSLTGGKATNNFEFPVANQYTLAAAAESSIREDDLDSAPTYTDHAKTQYKNVVEKIYHGVKVNDFAASLTGRISGVATYGEKMTTDDLLAEMIMIAIQEEVRNIEYRFLQGSYDIVTDADETLHTRGLIEAASGASNTVAAGGVLLSEKLLKSIILTMWNNGARFRDPVFIVNGFQAQQLTKIFGYAPPSRTIGGLSISQVLFDLAGTVGIMVSPQQPTDTLTVADLSVCSPVFLNVKDRGPGIWYYPHAKTVAAETGHLFGAVGLDHGPYFAHGTITGLATSE